LQQLSPDGQRVLRIALGSILTVPLAVFIVVLGDDLGYEPVATVIGVIVALVLAVVLGVWWELYSQQRVRGARNSPAVVAGAIGAGLLCSTIISDGALLALCVVLMDVMVAATAASILHFVSIARNSESQQPGP
jgi:hypothetical protein